MLIPNVYYFAKELISAAYLGIRPALFGTSLLFPDITGVTGVGIELKRDASGRVEELSLVVYLANEVPGLPSDLSVIFPMLFPHIAVSWRVTGEFVPLNGGAAVVAVGAGVPIALKGASLVGTLGAVVQSDIDPHQRFVLSCNHILAENNPHIATSGENRIVHLDGSLNPPEIAEMEGLPLICQLHSLIPNQGDFALAKVTSPAVKAQTPAGMPALIRNKPLSRDEFIAGDENVVLKKVGAATGVSRGQLISASADFSIRYNDMGMRATFHDQYLVGGSGFSAPGDSGSLVMTDDGLAMGLVFANARGATAVCPLAPLFDAMHCSFAPLE